MAVYVIVVDNFTKNDDPLLLGIGQMLWVGVIAFLLWCLEDPRTFFALTYTNEMLASIFLLAFLPGPMPTSCSCMDSATPTPSA